jgi:hypothetical protein
MVVLRRTVVQATTPSGMVLAAGTKPASLLLAALDVEHRRTPIQFHSHRAPLKEPICQHDAAGPRATLLAFDGVASAI